MSDKENSRIKVANFSPLDPIKAVLTCSPGIAASQALLMDPELSLFETTAPNNTSIITARTDHSDMRDSFAQENIQVYDLAIALAHALNKIKHPFNNKLALLAEIHNRSMEIHIQNGVASNVSFERTMDEMGQLLEEDYSQMGAGALALNAVLTRLIDLKGNPMELSSKRPPIGNILFSRDSMHVTGDTLGTNRMRFTIRRPEVALAELALKELGVDYSPLPTSDPKATLEGGDILPVEINGHLFALIGQAERTSKEGVDAWYNLHESTWKKGVIPLVISGPKKDTQDQMHLDTWFQQVAKSAAIHCGEITKKRTVSLLEKRNGTIRKSDLGTFYSWILRNFEYSYDMTREEQRNYAPNVLVNGNGYGKTSVFVSRADSPKVTEFISEHARVIPMNIAEITKLYGAAHCATQEFRASKK